MSAAVAQAPDPDSGQGPPLGTSPERSPGPRAGDKAPDAFRTISEVAEELGLVGALVLLAAFVVVERRVDQPVVVRHQHQYRSRHPPQRRIGAQLGGGAGVLGLILGRRLGRSGWGGRGLGGRRGRRRLGTRVRVQRGPKQGEHGAQRGCGG